MAKKSWFTIAVAAAGLALAALSYLLLPETAAVQWSAGGAVGNTLPRPLAVLLGVGVDALLLLLGRGMRGPAAAVLPLLGPVLQLVILIMNLR